LKKKETHMITGENIMEMKTNCRLFESLKATAASALI